MSERKDFLSRWSQRKLHPQTEKPAAEKQAALSEAGEAAETPAAVPEFDITTLPSLESIGADSDIRAFLQRGVPASLTRAALRRAWSADPAIRDFVGLAENSWDFNAPNPFLGFGPLNAEEVKQAAARFFAGSEQTTAEIPAEDVPDGKIPEDTAQSAEPAPQAEAPSEPPREHAALQQEDGGESEDAEPTPHRHGSALPR